MGADGAGAGRTEEGRRLGAVWRGQGGMWVLWVSLHVDVFCWEAEIALRLRYGHTVPSPSIPNAGQPGGFI